MDEYNIPLCPKQCTVQYYYSITTICEAYGTSATEKDSHAHKKQHWEKKRTSGNGESSF